MGLTGLGLPAALVVALRGDTRIVGLLAVERSDAFGPRERRLLEAVGAHAGSALESGQAARALAAVTELKERLAHEARHDPLTGLANRSLFALRVEAALAREGNGARGDVPRPRRLQGHQRHARACGGRCPARRGRRPPALVAARRRPRRAHGRRRVRRAARARADLGRGRARRRARAWRRSWRRSRCRSAACACARASAWRSRAAAPARRPSCCATPTSRCTRRRPAGDRAARSSRPACTTPSRPGTRSSAICATRSPRATSGRTSSRSWSFAAAAAGPSRRSRAGTTRVSGCSCPSASSSSRRRPT